MNRIILIGNGFDLSHGLPTKYEDFMRSFWMEFCTQIKGCNMLIHQTPLVDFGYTNITPETRMRSRGLATDLQYSFGFMGNFTSAQELKNFICGSHSIKLKYKSELFENINNNITIHNWVDIEAEYYKLLQTTYIASPQKLNEEFAIVRTKLIEYLTSIQNRNINNSIVNQATRECMMAPFCANEISIEGRAKWNEFLKCRIEDEYLSDTIKLYGESEARERLKQVLEFKKAQRGQIDNMGIGSINGNELPSAMLYPDRIMLLNFNYTKTADMYMPADEHNFPINHIHGHLDNPDSVIFGYGDELDNKYQEISSLNNNELLKNIKSIRYLEDVNYRNVLEFVESDPYQIYIMGHSCGTSDRTLLNTLFEHQNCVSIKPFYYQNDEGQDNYIEIVQNISRNFSNAQKMRDRVVNKTFCQPLPQRIASNE